MPKDYYIVLGVSRGANLSKIKKAYRTVIKRHHPDITRSKDTTQRFLEIREAYETLSNEERRKTYDEALSEQRSKPNISKTPIAVKKRRILFDEAQRRHFSFTDDFFRGFVPGFFDIDRGRQAEKDLYFEAVLSPREALQGGLFPVSVPVVEPCPRCSKTGFWEDFFCPICSGYGRVRSERSFSVSIPPHVKDGTEMRLSMEDIGLTGSYVNILVLIDPDLQAEDW